MALDELDRRIVNTLQAGIAVCDRPFEAPAAALGIAESELIERLRRLREGGVLSRFGPLFDVARLGGAFCLCAMKVPVARFDEVAEQVNAFAEVAHNYEREHPWNLWFVLATETDAGIDHAVSAIEGVTGLDVLVLPKLEEYFIGLRLEA